MRTLKRLLQSQNFLLFALLVFVFLILDYQYKIVFWRFDRVQEPLIIASGAAGGQYELMGLKLKEEIEKKETDTTYTVQVLNTQGSLENLELLNQSQADFIFYQMGSVRDEEKFKGINTVSPLYYEYANILVKSSEGISSLADLAGKKIVVGTSGSGTYVLAQEIFEHYNLWDKIERIEEGSAAMKRVDVSAGVIVAGLKSPTLNSLLTSGTYEMLQLSDVFGIAENQIEFDVKIIPKGYFSVNQKIAIPSDNIQAIAVKALLLTRNDVSLNKVNTVLTALYQSNYFTRLDLRRPTLSFDVPYALHPATADYIDPNKFIRKLNKFIDGIIEQGYIILIVVTILVIFLYLQKKSRELKINAYRKIIADIYRKVQIMDRHELVNAEERIAGIASEISFDKSLSHAKSFGSLALLLFQTQLALQARMEILSLSNSRKI